jgi:hypothetical protein
MIANTFPTEEEGFINFIKQNSRLVTGDGARWEMGEDDFFVIVNA